MTAPPEENSDEELANLMADTDVVHDEDGNQITEGTVEAGIPPQLSDENSEINSSEESFSVSDFEEDFQSTASAEPSLNSSHDASEVTPDEPNASVDSSGEDEPAEQNIEKSNGSVGGEVSEFRQTLANLSRQLELDKLAFLHNALKDQGEDLPSLDEIASDISGKKFLRPKGDFDLYGKRPSARLDGWISGLSFGSTKRAKKFSK